MMKKKHFVSTAVCLLLLALLVACSGSETSEEVESTQDDAAEAEEEIADGFEATGSESDGKGILPTPISGAKVATTRKGSRQFDLFFLVQPGMSESINLEGVTDWLIEQSIPIETLFGLGYLNDNVAVDEAGFTSDFEEIVDLLTGSAISNNQTQLSEDLLVQKMALPAWRIGADHLLFVFIEEGFLDISDVDLTTLSDTAVTQSATVYPFLIGNFSVEEELFWQQLADGTNGRLLQIPDAASSAAWNEILTESLDHALVN
jgi:hypothetical protein